MRKVLLLALLVSPIALAQSVSVETNSLMRLPNTTSTLQLERLDVADYGTLLIPANVTELKVDDLRGEAVKALQRRLGLVVDGAFGPRTEAAVRQWQRERGLVPDGYPSLEVLTLLR